MNQSHNKLNEEKIDRLANEKLASLLSLVDPQKIVRIDKPRGIVYIGGNRVDNNRLANLKAEAEFFLASDLWSLLYETPKALAEQAMFVSGESLDDMKKGRSMLYTLSTQKNIIDTFKSYTPKK